MTKSTRWDMARSASERPLPKPRKMHGPMGTPVRQLIDALGLEDARFGEPSNSFNLRRLDRVHDGINDWIDQCCAECGHHVCSCEAAEPVQQAGSVDVSVPTPVEIPQCIYCGCRACHRPSCLVLWNQNQRASISGMSDVIRGIERNKAVRDECDAIRWAMGYR